jgi:CPA2 family monovalent cation:H+ antiporter-2
MVSRVAIVLIAKPLVALAIVALIRDAGTAATVAVGLAQIGGFRSFSRPSANRSAFCRPKD